jgi:hypothetical protein
MAIIVQVFFSFFFTDWISQHLQNKIGSGVQINLEKARLNLFTRNLRLSNFSITYLSDSGENQEIHFEKVELQGLAFHALLREGQIKADFLRVENPGMSFQWNSLDSLASEQAYRLPAPLEKISEDSYIRAGEINQISLEISMPDAGLASRQSFTMDLLFEDARATHGRRTVGFFEIRLRDYSFDLPDGLHRISAREALLNTRDRIIKGKELRLFPLDHAGSVQSNLYQLYLPEWQMNTDILSLLDSDSLIVDSLFIGNADFRFISDLESPFSVNLASSNSPYQLIQGVLQTLRIKHLEIKNAQAGYFLNTSEVNPRISAGNVRLIMEDFLLNENSVRDPDRILLSRQIEGEIYDVRIALKDSIHIAESERLRLSSKDRLFRAEGVQIRPNSTLIGKPGQEAEFQYFTLSLPGLDLSGANLAEMINGRFFTSQNLDIQYPRLALYLNDKEENRILEKVEPLDVYPYLSEFFNHVNIDQLRISQGQFYLSSRRENGRDSLGIASLGLELYGLQIDSLTAQKTQNKIFYAENIALEMAGYYLRLADGIHTLQADSLRLSTFDSLITLKELKLKPENPLAGKGQSRYTYFDMEIPQVQLEAITIKEAFYNENIKVKRVLALAPRMKTESFNTIARLRDPEDRNPILSLEGAEKILGDYFSSLEIMKVEIEEGHLTSSVTLPNERVWLTDTDLEAEITGLNFRPERGLYAQNTRMELGNFYLALPDQTHTLKANDISFDLNTARLQVNGLSINAKENSTIPTQVNILADSLILLNYRPGKETFFVQQTGPLEVYQPKAALKLYPGSEKKSTITPLEILAPVIQVNGWLIQNGSLDIRIYGENKQDKPSRLLSNVQWVGDTTLVLGSEREYASKAIRNTRFVQLDNLQFNQSLEENQLRIATLNYRNTSQRLEARDLFIAGKRSQNTSTSPFHLAAEGLIINGFLPEKLYSEKEFSASSTTLQEPILRTSTFPIGAEGEDSDNKTPFDFEIHLGELMLNEGQIIAARDGKDSLRISGLNGSIKGILFDETHLKPLQEVQPRLFFDGFAIMDKEGIYRYSSGSIAIDRGAARMVIKDFAIMPTLSEDAFYKKLGVARDYLQLQADSLVLEGLDYDALVDQEAWIAEDAHLYGLEIRDLKNRKWPEDPKRTPPFPMELLLQMDKTVHLKKLHLHDAVVRYEEIPKTGGLSGKMEFFELNAEINNLSNVPDSLQKNDLLTLRAQARVMNKAWVSLNFQTHLLDKEGQFAMDGRLEEMEMTAFNPVLKPLTFIEVVEGELKSFDFYIEANKQKAGGRVRMEYRNLKVAILDENSPNLSEEKAFTSFLANTFVIRKRSSRKIGQAPWQEVEFERDESKSIFNFWWKSLLSGIKPSLGL